MPCRVSLCYFDVSHYNSLSYKKRHYNSPIRRFAITISSLPHPCHFLRLPRTRPTVRHVCLRKDIRTSSTRLLRQTERARGGRVRTHGVACARGGAAALARSPSTPMRRPPPPATSISRSTVHSTITTSPRDELLLAAMAHLGASGRARVRGRGAPL